MPACSSAYSRRRCAVGEQGGLEFQRYRAARAVEGQAFAGRVAGVPADAVRKEIPRMSRLAVALEVRRGGAEHAPHREQLVRDDLLGARRKELQRAVEAFLHRIDNRVVDDHVQQDLRVARLELLQHRRQVPEHEARQGMDAQAARGRRRDIAHLVHDLVGAAHQFGAVAQEGLAEFRQPDAAGVAVKQRGADEDLQLLDARGDHRAGHAHLPRRFGKAARIGDTDERIDSEKSVHATARGVRGGSLPQLSTPQSTTRAASGRLHRFEQPQQVLLRQRLAAGRQ